MVERLKNLINYPSRILITGASGCGKSLLATSFILNFAKENKKCFIVSFLNKDLLVTGLKKTFPETKNFLGKNIFLAHIEPKNETEFFEDIEYVILNFKPQVILVDPLYPEISRGVFYDICKILENRKITGIFCYSNALYIYGLVDYVIEIFMERKSGKIKREIVIKSRKGDVNKSFVFTLKEGKVFLEELIS